MTVGVDQEVEGTLLMCSRYIELKIMLISCLTFEK